MATSERGCSYGVFRVVFSFGVVGRIEGLERLGHNGRIGMDDGRFGMDSRSGGPRDDGGSMGECV